VDILSGGQRGAQHAGGIRRSAHDVGSFAALGPDREPCHSLFGSDPGLVFAADGDDDIAHECDSTSCG